MGVPKFTSSTAAAVIIANMIGTGVFTSLGFQLLEIQSGFVLLLLWVVGGITALCGALSYAELGTALPRSGGEYNFIGKIYHPSAGFISGWISVTMGFSAPTALVAMTFGSYLSAVFQTLSANGSACLLVLFVTFFHTISHQSSGRFQSLFTLVKLFLIVAFCLLCGIAIDQPQKINFIPTENDASLLLSGSFAISLIYVNYAYTGWNAITYFTNEIHDPQRHLPKILVLSTVIVMVLYVALNFIFLYTTAAEAMTGKVEIAYIVAQQVFGEFGAKAMGLTLSLLLISTSSAMIIAGPRVLKVIGEDYRVFKFFSVVNKRGIPANAILFQSVLTLFFILTSSFESILIFSGFILGINSLFTIIGVFLLRFRHPDLNRPYKIWLYPFPPLIFLAITLWTLIYIVYLRPEEALWSLFIIGTGAVFYGLTVLLESRKTQSR